MSSTAAIRTYQQPDAVVFLKTKEAFGGLSNMASGYPLLVNGIRILSSEALYQACRFPSLPDVQRLIIQQTSPMTAKMVSKPYRAQSRPDWERVRVKIMRWCLRVKLAQHRQVFGKLLLETGDLPIVEKSFKDEYWGAKPSYADTLVGMNVLGRLLMELREELKSGEFDAKAFLETPAIPDFLLDGKPIEPITRHQDIAGVNAMLLYDLHTHKQYIENLARTFGAQRIRVFGSVARGEDTEASDIDFLVDFPQGYDLFRQRLPLMEQLKALLGRQVEVIPEHELNPHIKSRVLAEAVEL